LFRLFSHFSNVKNPNALYAYKEIVQSLIDNHSDIDVREFYFQNFLDVFSENQQIPPGLLIEPLIKQIRASSLSKLPTYKMNSIDFDFLSMIAKHPNLQLKHVILLLDLLSMIYLQNIVFSQRALTPFIQLLNQHIHEQIIQEFIV
jgi:hypothetical protein